MNEQTLQLEEGELLSITDECIEELANGVLDLTENIELPLPLELTLTNSKNEKFSLTLTKIYDPNS